MSLSCWASALLVAPKMQASIPAARMNDRSNPGNRRSLFIGNLTLCIQFYFAQHLHHLRITVVEEEALLRVQRNDRGHVFGTQLEVEDVEILDDSFLPN